MDEIPKYRYVDEITEGNVPIEIMGGKYKGLMLRYNHVVLIEKNEELHFDYDYELVKNPDEVEMNQELQDIFTSILVSVLDEQIYDMPDDLDLLKEGNGEKRRESHTSKFDIQ
tara:strand:- start:3145 stop:3483 length:339 start_codon:yes stop_codon:yes gene_type:complete